MGTPAKTAADRNREWRARQKAGRVRLTIEHDRLWLAQLLYDLGISADPDDDAKASLQANMQSLVMASC
jgi:hypothetical protein